ncbi:MAG: shikimate dehydrogenase [Chloroflexota bacterium]|nr:shikimate dehydrogenase [Chloroflexota bacterium]
MDTALGIIGYPIGHSMSPVFQQAALDACGVDSRYVAYQVAPEEVEAFVNGLRQPGTLGINVTVPHKLAVMPFLDEIDDWATEAGAVNTIVNREGRLTGHNTDGYGFLRVLREGADFKPKGRRTLILGAGGAARGVVLALAREGVGVLTIANRTPERAESLAQLALNRGISARAIPLAGTDLAEAAATAELIVNCTTIGMTHGPGEDETPLPASVIPSTALVNDLVYNPLETRLLREAAQAGAKTLGGIQMLVYQGAASFEMWLERAAPVPVMLEAATRAMQSRS